MGGIILVVIISYITYKEGIMNRFLDKLEVEYGD